MAKAAQPISLSVLTGNAAKRSKAEIERRMKAEQALQVEKDKLKAPTWLGKVGKKEFKFIVDETESIELLTNLDLHVLAVYCNVYEQYVECSRRIIEDGIMMDNTASTEAGLISHPLFVKQNQLVQQMRQMQTDLGLSPSARARLALSALPKEEKQEGRFDNI